MAWTLGAIDFTSPASDEIDPLTRDYFNRVYPRPATIPDPNNPSEIIPNPALSLNLVQWRRRCLKRLLRDLAVNEKHYQQEQQLNASIEIPSED